jgi:undecaprenyl diphosphate synthase
MSLKEQIKPETLPHHIAIIMDGNGRWAKGKGFNRIFGHKNGVTAVRETTEACAELGIKYLTLYAFSSENWNRPKFEVNALMELLIETIKKETETFIKNGIKLNTIGRIEHLPAKAHKSLLELKELTKNHNKLELVLALSYGSKDEIVEAVKSISEKVKAGTLQPENITNETISQHLYTHNIPDPELLIRTSGEHRISNFLLWQIAYSELYFTEVLWPDFRKEDLYNAIISYQHRERRFGKTSEQLATK